MYKTIGILKSYLELVSNYCNLLLNNAQRSYLNQNILFFSDYKFVILFIPVFWISETCSLVGEHHNAYILYS
jgi:hypothetical protein